MMKDQFIEAHEALIEEYMETHPGVTWDQAYDRCSDAAYDRMRDSMADRADMARLRAKEGQ